MIDTNKTRYAGHKILIFRLYVDFGTPETKKEKGDNQLSILLGFQ